MSTLNAIVIKTAAAKIRKIERPGKATLIFNEQTAAIESDDDFPKPFKFRLAEDAQPYPPGRYLVDASSFDVGDFDTIKFGRTLKLIPVPTAPAK